MTKRVDILLVEESPSEAVQIELILERAGYRVDVATDGAAGWWQACATVPRLILLDVDLPALNGYQVLEYLKHYSLTRKIPVVMLIDRERLDDMERARTLGANSYVAKQDAPGQIVDLVRELLGEPVRSPDRKPARVQPQPADNPFAAAMAVLGL